MSGLFHGLSHPRRQAVNRAALDQAGYDADRVVDQWWAEFQRWAWADRSDGGRLGDEGLWLTLAKRVFSLPVDPSAPIVRLTGAVAVAAPGAFGPVNTATGRRDQWSARHVSVPAEGLPVRYRHGDQVGDVTHVRRDGHGQLTFYATVNAAAANLVAWGEAPGVSPAFHGLPLSERSTGTVNAGRLDELSLTDAPAYAGTRAELIRAVPTDADPLDAFRAVATTSPEQRRAAAAEDQRWRAIYSDHFRQADPSGFRSAGGGRVLRVGGR